MMTDETVPSISNVHEAVRLAVLESQDEQRMAPANFKLHPNLKSAANSILHHNGTDLSKFLRACVQLLVKDYAGQKGLARIVNADPIAE